MESVNIPRNKISCGDCMEGLKELPDGCVDLIMMDPPYLLNTDNGHGGRWFGPVKGSTNHMKELHLSDIRLTVSDVGHLPVTRDVPATVRMSVRRG